MTTIDSNDLRFKIVQWLKSINLVQGLIELFSHEKTNQVHSNASQILCDLIRISRDQILTQREIHNECFSAEFGNEASKDQTISIQYLHKNSLLEDIESNTNLSRLFDLIVDSINKPNCSLVHGLEVFLTLLEPASWSNELNDLNESCSSQNMEEEKLRRDKERIEIAMFGMKAAKECCSSRLEQLHNLLVSLKPNIEHSPLSNGIQVPLFGTNRLSIVKLISRLVCLNDSSLNQELIKLGTLNVILDMMFIYKWNNFLHFQLKDIISNCFSFDFKLVASLNRKKLLQQDVDMPNEDEQENQQIPRQNSSDQLINLKIEQVQESDENKTTFIKHVTLFSLYEMKNNKSKRKV